MYAQALPALVTENIGDAPLTVRIRQSPQVQLAIDHGQQVWTSTLQRTVQTAQFLPYTKLTWKSLDELDAGVCDGMTYGEIEVFAFFFLVELFLEVRIASVSRGLRQP